MTLEEMRDKLRHVQRYPYKYFPDLKDRYGWHDIYLWSSDGERWCIVCNLDDGDGREQEIGHIEL